MCSRSVTDVKQQQSLPQGSQPKVGIYNDGVLYIEHENYYLTCEGQPVKLRRTEFQILSRLAQSAGRIVTAKDLWHDAWKEGKPLNSVSLHVYIYHLRRKLSPFGIQIETMVNVGYRLAGRQPSE